jgi:IS5 family transposase
LDEVLDTADLPKDIPLKADKVYQSKKNTEILKIAYKNKPLTHWRRNLINS